MLPMQNDKPAIETVITHSGGFHADDLFAFALLNEVFYNPHLIRTRDAELIKNAGKSAIVFDVGGEYDPDRHRFDHHQIDKPLRDDGIAYSSFGLVWKHYGMMYVAKCTSLPAAEAMRVYRDVDSTLVRYIDAVDNGMIPKGEEGMLHPFSLASTLMMFKPAFDNDDAGAMDKAFKLAAKIVDEFLYHAVQTSAAQVRSNKMIRDAIAQAQNPAFIKLPYSADFKNMLSTPEHEDVLFVVSPSGTPEQPEWCLNVVPKTPHTYEARCALPKEWAGLRGEAMAEVTGVPDSIFCHTGRFVAAARSEEGVMRLLDQALKYAAQQSDHM